MKFYSNGMQLPEDSFCLLLGENNIFRNHDYLLLTCLFKKIIFVTLIGKLGFAFKLSSLFTQVGPHITSILIR